MKKLKKPVERGCYRNVAEQKFYEVATKQGWEVTKRGFPDFICYRNGTLMLVDVKKNKQQRMKYNQHRLMEKLDEYGVKCYKWSPDNDWLSTRDVNFNGNGK